MLCKDGSTVWTEVRVSAIRDEKGQAVGILGVTRDISERKRAEENLHQSLEDLRKAMQGIIQAMALTVETRDPYTAGHQKRVAELAQAIAQEMKLPEDQVEGLRMAGIVHDLGKIAVPAEILSKPIKLSDIEFRLIQVHPQASYDILKDIDFPWPLAKIVLQHHERMNGSGYPLGLKNGDIFLGARILAVADVVEAMSSYRPYRPAWGLDKALEEISKQKGILYDSAVVDACLKLFVEGRFQFDKGQEQRILMEE
jgi:HD-GYP domain-containing protein (c-di-GMP phosphodiesterase class II)